MDDSETYMDMQIIKSDTRSPLRAAQERQGKMKIGNRPNRLICLLCLVTSALIVIVAGLSIHVSQIRQSKVTSDGNCSELNSNLKSKISEFAPPNLSQRTCLKNLSELNSYLSVLQQMHNDLSHQFTEMETKYRSVNEAKAQICELLTNRREQAFSQDWIRNEDRCYFISTFETSNNEARQHCLNSKSNLLEINSTEEEKFVNKALQEQGSAYWMGKCRGGKVASKLVYKEQDRNFECSECKHNSCKNDQHRFICEKSASLCPDIPEKIQDLCQ